MSSETIRVLLVSGNPGERAAIAGCLSQYQPPYQLHEAQQLAEAEAVLSERPIDVVVLAQYWESPEGHALLHQLGNLPAILLVEKGQEPLALEAMRHGAYCCSVKDSENRWLQLLPAAIESAARYLRTEQALQQQITALREANTKLQEASAAVEEAARHKAECLAHMSHEIRTPLTAIVGFAETLLTEGDISRAPPERVDAIDAILRNSSHLLRIIDDVLDLSRIEAGKLRIERLRFSPAEIVAEVQRLMQPQANLKRLALEVEYLTPVPETIHSDPTRLRQILLNLVGNAIKFTDRGSVRLTVSLLADQSPPALQFEVIDTGVGIAPEQLERIFCPFVQGDASTTRRFGGTGLGLSISRRLAELLGGAICVESRPGQGSTFRVTIATGPLEGVPMMVPSASTQLVPAGFAQPLRTSDSELPLPYRILLAEDAPDIQRLIKRMLEKAGAEVTVVENGAEAIQCAMAASQSGRPFDVVLMDIQMPVLNGYQATRALRANRYRGPIIALTAEALAGQRERCLEAGCDDYVSKPVNRDALLAAIARSVQVCAAQQVDVGTG